MAKKLLEVTNFSGGLNCYSDARDIKDNEFAQNWNAVVDKSGIIRASGMAEDYIDTDSHLNTNFQNGFGLFQFAADYSVSEIKSDFNSGITTGAIDTLVSAVTAVQTVSDLTPSPSSAWQTSQTHSTSFAQTSTTGSGSGLKVTATTDGSGNPTFVLTGERGTGYAASEVLTFTDPGTTSNTATLTISTLATGFILEDKNSTSTTDDYYNDMIIFIYAGAGIGESRIITDYHGSTRTITSELFATTLHDKDDANPSKYIIYHWKLDGTNWHGNGQVNKKDFITNGINQNMLVNETVSRGIADDYFIFSKDTASADTTENLGYIEYAAGISLTPGAEYLFSFDAAAKNKWYNIISDGHEDGTTSTNYGEKPPWVQLYSEDVEDTSGCVRLIGDATPTGGSAGDDVYLSGAWTVSKTNLRVSQTSSTGNGIEARFNIVTDGSGNPTFYLTDQKGHSYVDNEILTFTDPHGSQTANVKVTEINHVGLSLQANGSWISKTNQSKYLTNVDSNYVDNGDFADGTSDSWSTSGSNIDYFIEAAAGVSIGGSDGTAVNYDGSDNGTAWIHANSDSFYNSDGEPSGYIYQTLTLDDLTDYHLNFLFTTWHGMRYAIYDVTNSSYIIPWTSKPANRVIGNGSFWYSYANQSESSQSGAASVTMDYIRFHVPKSPASILADVTAQAGTSSIQIRFTPAKADSAFFLTGVTVHKAHNDLTGLSYQTSASSPFHNGIVEGFSKYNMKFTVPIGYSSPSTWKLRLHGGQYGFRSGNDLGQSDGVQEVYFDNIKLSSEGNDVITMLTDSKSVGTNISLHSKTSDAWIPKMMSWVDTGAQPNYDYINGMLKISDGNFKTNNSNKLMYYSKDDTSTSIEQRGWITRNTALASPPTNIQIGELDSDMLDIRTFNGTDYLNSLFENQKYVRASDPVQGAGTSEDGTSATDTRELQWPVGGQFGPGKSPPIHTGLICRNIIDEDSETPWAGKYSEASTDDTAVNWIAGMPAQLYSPYDDLGNENIWYGINIAGTITSESSNYVEEYDKLDLMEDDGNRTPFGGGYRNEGTRNSSVFPRSYGYKQDKGVHTTNAKSHHEKGFPFFALEGEYSHLGGEQGSFKEFIEENEIGPIAKIKVDATWIQHGRNYDGFHKASLPYFNICYGSFGNGSQTSPFDFSLEGILYESLKSNTISLADNDIGIGGKYLSWQSMAENPSLISAYDSEERIQSADIRYDEITSAAKSSAEIRFVHEQHFDITGPGSLNSVEEGVNIRNFGIGLKAITNEEGAFEYSTDHQSGGWHISNVWGDSDDWAVGTDLVTNHRGEWNYFQTWFINEITISFYNTGWIDEFEADDDVSNSGAKINFAWGIPESPSLGWGGRSYKVGITSVNTFGEESSLSITDSSVGVLEDGTFHVREGDAPELQVKLGQSVYDDPFITKTKFYMQASESDIWYLQCYVDHKSRKIYSTTSNYSSNGLADGATYSTLFVIPREHLKDFNEVNSYESETMVAQDDALAVNNANLTCRYKTSVVANNRLYVGNIYHGGRLYEDRMLKSPIGKYNILPQSNFIDVAIQDGDKITGLAYYKDKILQFKKKKVFVINISGDYEFLEDTFENVGVLQQCSIATTSHGIVWANRTGCYLYNGEKLTNLIDNIIPPTSDYATITDNYWLASVPAADGIPIVGYIENRDSIIIKFKAEGNTSLSTPEGASYHFPTKSWSFIAGGFRGLTGISTTGDLSNMVTNDNGDLIYYHNFEGGNINIKKWTHSALTDSTDQKLFFFTTKDFTFGNIAARKKLYKVYITYKSNSADTDVVVTGAVDGISSTGTFAIAFSTSSVFKGTSTACYTGSLLQGTSNVWKTAELKFATPSEVNNIFSFQLNFKSITLPSDFQINDISISYRVKSIK